MSAQGGNTFNRVLRMFKHYGCDEQTLLTKQKLIEILNKQATINLHRNFNSSIIEEMWGQTETNSRGEATVLTFTKVFSEAAAILEERIGVIDGPTGIMQKEAQLQVEQNKLKGLQTQYQQGREQSYDQNNTTRRNIAAIEVKIKELRQNRAEFQKDLQEMKGSLQIQERLPTIERSEYIAQSRLQQSNSPPAPSSHLSLVFKVTVLAIALQMFLLDFRQSFLALMCYFLILAWLFLGYYDQHFVKVIAVGLGLSCALDIAFTCLEILGKAGKYRNHSGQTVWVYISGGVLIVEVALRILLLTKLCMFLNPSSKRQYFVLFGEEIELNSRSGKHFSPEKGRD